MKTDFPMVPLGKVAKPVNRAEVPIAGTLYRQIGVKLWGVGAYEREPIDGAQTRYKTLSRADEDDIIVNKIWARNGSVAVVPKSLAGCYGSNEFPTFIPIREKLEPLWFYWYTKTKGFWEQCDEKSQGTSGKNRIRPERFLEIMIPLPPISEQRRIVARIEELAAKIDEAQILRREAIEETGTLQFTITKGFFSLNGHGFPMSLLENLTTRITKGESPEWQGFTYQESGPTFVRSENVLWGELDLSRQTYIPTEFHKKLTRSQLKPGDVLINLVGASIGRSCVVPTDIGEANVNQAVAVISPDPKRLDGKYLMHFLISKPAQDTIHGGKVETARPNISLGDLRNLILPVPPVLEQRRIVTHLRNWQAKVTILRQIQAETSAELDAMLPSILDKALKGELH